MARYFSLPDGTYVEIPEGMDTDLARRIALARFAGTRGVPKEAATRGSDVLSSLTSGVANTLGIVPGIAGLFGASYENAPLAGTVKGIREYAAKTETPETTYKKYLIDQAIANASKQGGISGEAIETLKQLAINPRVTGLKLLELIPDIVTAVGTGGLGSLAGKAAVKAFSKEAGEEAVKRGAARGAAAGAIGTSAAQEGTSTGQEVYEETYRLLRAKNVPEAEARAQAESAARGATIKQGLTVAALGKVLPGAEKAVLGVGKGGVRRVAAGESAEEGLTGISGQLTQNIAAGEIDPTIALSRGVGRAGTEGAVLGALAGAGVGAFTRRPTAPEAPPEDPAKAVTDTAVTSAVQRGDATVDEVEEADTLARIAKIKSDAAAANVAAEKEKEAAEAKKVEGEDALRAAEEKKEPAPAAAPAEVVTPAENLQPPADTTDVTQTAQTQQAKEEGQEAPSAAASTNAAPEVVEGEVPAQTTQTAGAPSGTVAEGSGISVPVVGGTSGSTPAAGTGAPATGGVGQTSVDAGGPAGGTAGEPAALTVKKPRKAKAVEEGPTEEDIADEAAAVPTAYEKFDLPELEAKAAEVKAAPLAKAGEKISTRANLRTFDVAIPIDQARLEEKLAEVRKIPEKSLTPAQRAIRWYSAYVEANGGALKDIPLYLAHSKADPTLATTGSPKKYLQPAITWLNSNLGGTAGNNINAAAAAIQTRLKEVESQRTESDSGKEKRTGGRKVQEETVEEKPDTFEERLKRIAASEKKDAVRAVIAERILQTGAKPDIVEGRIENGSPAAFDPKRNAIIFDPKNIQPETDLDALFMHEATHAVVDHMIDNPNGLSGSQKNALARLKNLHEAAKKELGEEFNIDTLKEFAAETFSNPDFQAALKKTKSPITPFNFFDALARTIARLLGVTAEGNAFIDAVNSVDKLISAPTKSRKGKEVSYAPAEAKKIKIGNKEIEIQAKVTEPAVGTKKEKSDKQKAREALEAERAKNLIDLTLTKKEKLIRFAQNAQRPLVLLQEALRKKGVLSPDLALNDAITLQGSASDALARRTVDPLISEYQDVLNDIAKKSKVDLDEVLAQMDRYYAAMTSVERRLSKFFERAKLSEAGDRRRDVLFRAIVADKAELAKIKKGVVAADVDLLSIIPDEVTAKDARALYKKIEEVVLTDEVGKLQDINSSQFQVAAIRTDDGSEIDLDVDLANQIISETDAYLNKNPEIKKLYGQARTLQKDLEIATLKLNRDANYGSPQLDMLMNARGWKNYVPLRGAPTKYQPEDTFEKYEAEPPVMGTLVQAETKTKGRTTAAENSIYRSFAEATRSATRPSRTEVTQIIKNLVEKGYIAGSINKSDKAREEKGPSTFLERFIENKKLPREDNVVYHYGPDGKVDVIRIDNKDLARAIREVYQNSNPLIDRLNSVTSFVGRGFTRYNPSFWTKNFVVDILTNSFVFAAEHGKATQYLWQVASDLVDNKGTAKAMNFIRLYEKGNKASRDALEKLAEKDSWYKDALNYVDVGGKVSYMSGLSTKKQEEATYDRLGPNKIVRTAKQLDSFITPITDGLELAARVSAFRTARTIPEFKNDARGAIAYSKNLANFENVGLQGKTLGALFMFFRPSATGAVRALDALMKGKHGPRTAILALSMGYFIASMSQLLAGDDEEGRNRMETDDPDRWVRNWRLHLPGMESAIQIPWGFGMGTIASVGAQLWMLIHGRNSLGDFLSNTRTALFEGFLPLPFSQINFFEKPVQAVVDSVAPSVTRPLLQYAFNRDSLDREIFNSTFNRYSPAYLSKENVPESVNQFSRALYDVYTLGTGSPPNEEVEKILSPTGIGFFMNNYLSAVYKVGTALDDTVRYTFFDGQKTPDAVKASMIFAGFKGTPANYDYQKFNELRQEVKGYESAIKTFERNGREEQLDAYLDKYPEREDAVKVFNKFEGGKLKELRAEANRIRDEYNDRPAERQELLKENRREQNALMRDILEDVREILAR